MFRKTRLKNNQYKVQISNNKHMYLTVNEEIEDTESEPSQSPVMLVNHNNSDPPYQ